MRIILFLIAIVMVLPSSAQILSSRLTLQIDSIFSEFNQNTPGCAIAIVRDNDVIFSKAYGMANLEHRVPITPETVFNMASVSKQFTGMGIALLARQGKISLEEDIRTYLPWVPNFKQRITVRNLLHHMSGIRDHLIMTILGGVPGNGLLTHDIAVRYIKNYEALNFSPGENHAYSNSNYVLLAEIIKTTSGQTFNRFMDSVIFKPLNMKKSFFVESNSMIKDGASSYNKIGDTYNNILLNVYTNGDGGLYSTINDLAKWMINFLVPNPDDANLIQQLTAPSYLNNGKRTFYGMGIGNNTYNGYKQYTHSGSIAGFRSTISIFPELKFGFVIVSNYAAGRVGVKASQIINLILKEYFLHKSNTLAINPDEVIFRDTLLARSISGNYLAQNGGRYFLDFSNGKLLFQNQPLMKKGRNEMALASDSLISFSIVLKGGDTVIHHYDYGTYYRLQKYKVDSVLTRKLMLEYVGGYYNKELDKTFAIAVKKDRLILSNFLHGEIALQPMTKNDLFFQGGVTHMKMLRDSKNKIHGFEYSNASVTKLKFIKIHSSR